MTSRSNWEDRQSKEVIRYATDTLNSLMGPDMGAKKTKGSSKKRNTIASQRDSVARHIAQTRQEQSKMGPSWG